MAERDRTGLAPEVGEHEPAVALFGGADGSRHVRALLREARDILPLNGHLVMEIGYGQILAIESEVQDVRGLTLEAIREDLQGIPRVVIARKIW